MNGRIRIPEWKSTQVSKTDFHLIYSVFHYNSGFRKTVKTIIITTEWNHLLCVGISKLVIIDTLITPNLQLLFICLKGRESKILFIENLN